MEYPIVPMVRLLNMLMELNIGILMENFIEIMVRLLHMLMDIKNGILMEYIIPDQNIIINLNY